MAAPAKAVENWQDLGFSNVQRELDAQGAQISRTQEDGAVSRKALTAKTKEFRKLDDGGKLAEIRSLLKSYQAEIDTLTGRAKYAEQCFMSVYKSLALLPDPAPLLEAKDQEIERTKAAAASREAQLEEERQERQDSQLARDLERQTLRVAQLEKQLKQQQSKDAPTTDDSTRLQERIDALETELVMSKSQLARQESAAKADSASAAHAREELQTALSRLASQHDYDDLKQELAELRSSQGQSRAGATGAEDTVDGDEVTARRRVQTLEVEKAELNALVEQLQTDVERQRSLVAKLEEDITSMNSQDTFSTISGWTAVPQGAGRAGSVAGSLAGSMSGSASARDSPVSTIITQQRDRYKKRMHDLEEKVHASDSELTKTKKELEKLRQETYTLYDRIRHMQAPGGAGAGAGSAAGGAPASSSGLYAPLPDQFLKDLDVERRKIGLSKVEAYVLEFAARTVADEKFRRQVMIGTAVIATIWFLIFVNSLRA